MRVVILAKEFPNTAYLAACTFIYEQAKALAQKTETFVIAPVYSFPRLKRYEHYSQKLNSIPEYVEDGSLRIFHPRYPYKPSVLRRFMAHGFIKAASEVIKDRIGNFDVLHGHFLHEAGYAGIKISKQFGVPLAATAHGSDVNRILCGVNSKKYETARARKTLNSAQAVIAVSDTIKSVLLGYTRHSERIHRIYNGVDLKRFSVGDKKTARLELRLPASPEDKILLFASNILPEKGVFDFLDAFKGLQAECTGVHALFIGEDRTNGRFIEEIKTIKNVRYIGAVAHEHVAQYMQAADILVHPTYSEGFGLVLVESLACGCPVVSTSVGAVPEIISSESVGILIKPSNPNMLKHAIEEALQKEWKKDRLHQFASSFSIEKSIHELLQVYSQLIKKS
ncbi:MAG: glycosyltransferase [bacterium]|nr:glycosyltransferase [bacterium]